ncbi:hypothetical protein ACFXHA_00135 [Nocardia sp. NPDC059240]|uniref:hypothetical protein n=1 Tax=Nocardia sp. NPDC059240 TaxID=3346786 RepID=UPI003676F72F
MAGFTTIFFNDPSTLTVGSGTTNIEIELMRVTYRPVRVEAGSRDVKVGASEGNVYVNPNTWDAHDVLRPGDPIDATVLVDVHAIITGYIDGRVLGPEPGRDPDQTKIATFAAGSAERVSVTFDVPKVDAYSMYSPTQVGRLWLANPRIAADGAETVYLGCPDWALTEDRNLNPANPPVPFADDSTTKFLVFADNREQAFAAARALKDTSRTRR